MWRLGIWFRVWGLALIASVGSVGAAQAASASQSPVPAAGVAMTPAIQDRVLGPTEKTVSFSVTLANLTDKPVTFALNSDDFTALNQNGGLVFLDSDATRASSGHGLSSILRLDKPQVTIPANTAQQITARINDVSKLAVGGHYAAILAQALPDGTADTGNRVAINQVVSSLVFLETAGQGTRSLRLLPPPVNKLVFSLPMSANLVFKATGNTQTVPRGVVTIDHGNQEIGRGIVNDNSSLLLPGSSRLFQIPLSGTKHPLWPGKYTLRVQYRYEGSLGVTTYQKSFIYVDIQAIFLALILLIVGLYLLFKSRNFWKRQVFKNALRYRGSTAAEAPKKSITVSDKSHNTEEIKVVKSVKNK